MNLQDTDDQKSQVPHAEAEVVFNARAMGGQIRTAIKAQLPARQGKQEPCGGGGCRKRERSARCSMHTIIRCAL